jgi:hypothetical protein
MSIKQAQDAGLIPQNNDPTPTGETPTLTEVLIVSDNTTTQPLNIINNLHSATMKINSLSNNQITYSQSNGNITTSAPSNFIYQTTSSQSIPINTNITALFDVNLPGIPANNVGLGYNAGIFTNNSNRIMTCFVSYTIQYLTANNGGIRDAQIVYGNSLNCAVNSIEPSPEGPTTLTGSAPILLNPTQTFKVTLGQTADEILTTSNSIQILIL